MMQSVKSLDRQTPDYLSKDNTNSLKGILAICVLVHHLYQHSGLFRDGWLRLFGVGFQALGFVTVAMFFFLSGYGLIASYRKNPASIYHFVKHKILPFYVINIILIVIYVCVDLLLGQQITVVSILESFTFGGTVIANGWYIQVQLLYYIMFYLVFRFCKGKRHLIFMLGLHITYLLICVLFGIKSAYYERTFIFVAGMYWYEYRNMIDYWVDSKRYRWIIAWSISCVLFAATYFMPDFGMAVLFRGISYFFFVPAVILLLKKVKIQNKVTSFLGRISLEIYVLQGVFLMLFHAKNMYISNPYLYLLAVSISTIVTACILHPLILLVYRTFRKV